MKVHFHDKPDTPELKTLKEALNEGIKLTFGPDIPQPAEYDILVHGTPTEEQIEASQNLKALIIPYAGLSRRTRRIMLGYPDIAVYNIHHNASATAEMALALLFSATKNIVPFDSRLRKGDWTPRYDDNCSILLEGKNALILGYGSIGKNVARILSAIGMKVTAINRNGKKDKNGEIDVFPVSQLHEHLPSANVLMVTIPYSPETEDMINSTELFLMPSDSLLVNVSRGPVVNEKALFKALKTRHLFGAGLDVWYNYPKSKDLIQNTYPSDFPFHELDNVVMSPHRAGRVFEKEHHRMSHVAEVINNLAMGLEPRTRVDLERGY